MKPNNVDQPMARFYFVIPIGIVSPEYAHKLFYASSARPIDDVRNALENILPVTGIDLTTWCNKARSDGSVFFPDMQKQVLDLFGSFDLFAEDGLYDISAVEGEGWEENYEYQYYVEPVGLARLIVKLLNLVDAGLDVQLELPQEQVSLLTGTSFKYLGRGIDCHDE